MLPGVTWSVCHQLGTSQDRWCTSTLRVRKTSGRAKRFFTQFFSGELLNDDKRWSLFFTKVRGQFYEKEVLFTQWVPVNCTSQLSTVHFHGYLSADGNSIKNGHVFTMADNMNMVMLHGHFDACRIKDEEDVLPVPAELPSNIAAAMLHNEHMLWWVKESTMDQDESISCWALALMSTCGEDNLAIVYEHDPETDDVNTAHEDCHAKTGEVTQIKKDDIAEKEDMARQVFAMQLVSVQKLLTNAKLQH